MKNLLFFDLDGTLTYQEGEALDFKVVEVLRKARAKGNLVFINSGRTKPIIDSSYIKEVDGLVCGLGTYIEFQSKELYHHKLKLERCLEIQKKALEEGIECFFEGHDYISCYEKSENEVVKYLRDKYLMEGFDVRFYPDNELLFDKFCIFSDKNIDNFYNAFKDDFNMINRKPGFYEVEPKGQGKDKGIAFLCKYFDTDLDHCFAFGDSMNDLSMLSYVKHSIAMGNGDKALFDKVEFVTRDARDNGIEYALKHYGLI